MSALSMPLAPTLPPQAGRGKFVLEMPWQNPRPRRGRGEGEGEGEGVASISNEDAR